MITDPHNDEELKRLIWEEWESEIKEEDPRQMVFKYMKAMRTACTDDFENTELNIAIESHKGLWELYKVAGSDKYKLQKWGRDSDYPLVELNMTKGEFKDLETLFTNVKKHGEVY